MSATRQRTEEPTMVSALARVVDAGHKLVIDRIDLGRLEVQRSIEQSVVKIVLFLLAGVLAFGAWVTLQAAVIVLVEPPIEVSLFAVAAVNGGIAATLLFHAMRNNTGPRPTSPSSAA